MRWTMDNLHGCLQNGDVGRTDVAVAGESGVDAGALPPQSKTRAGGRIVPVFSTGAACEKDLAAGYHARLAGASKAGRQPSIHIVSHQFPVFLDRKNLCEPVLAYGHHAEVLAHGHRGRLEKTVINSH